MPKGAPCDTLGKKHKWRERDERYSNYSSQSVGKYWICIEYEARSEEKPTGVLEGRRYADSQLAPAAVTSACA